jgi:hypothetical protein
MGFTNLRWRNGKQPSVIRVEIVTAADSAAVVTDITTTTTGGSYFSLVGSAMQGGRQRVMIGNWTNSADVPRILSTFEVTDNSVVQVNTVDVSDTSIGSLQLDGASTQGDAVFAILRLGYPGPERLMYVGPNGETVTFIPPESKGGTSMRAAKFEYSVYIGSADLGSKTIFKYNVSDATLISSAALPEYIQSIAATATQVFALGESGSTIYVLNAATLASEGTIAALGFAPAQVLIYSGQLHYLTASSLYRRDTTTWTQLMSGITGAGAGATSLTLTANAFDGTVMHSAKASAVSGSSPSVFTFSVAAPSLAPTLVPLQQVLEAEILRCTPLTSGDIDMSAAAGKFVRGYEAYGSAASAISPLLDWYFLDMFCDDKIRLVARGGSVERTVPYSLTGAGDGRSSFAGLNRPNDVEIPKITQVQYANPLADGEVGAEEGGRIATGTLINTVQFNIYALPTEAKGRAITFTRDSRVASHTASISLSARNAARMQPGSVVSAIDNKGLTYRVRLTKMTWDRHVYACEVALDDPSVLTASAITSEATYAPVIELPAPITAEFLALDAPPLPGADATAGYLGLVKTAEVASATWFSSVDNVTFTPGPSFINDAVFGAVTAVSGTLTSDARRPFYQRNPSWRQRPSCGGAVPHGDSDGGRCVPTDRIASRTAGHGAIRQRHHHGRQVRPSWYRGHGRNRALASADRRADQRQSSRVRSGAQQRAKRAVHSECREHEAAQPGAITRRAQCEQR